MRIYSVQNFSIFDVEADVLVNPVNLVGIMGKGLALEFKNRFPQNFIMYKEWCADSPQIGSIFVWNENNQCIVNFPTKIHWRDPSKLEYVEESTIVLSEWLIDTERDFIVKTVAIPKVGCGLGGLDWKIVKPKMIEIFKKYLENVDIEIIFVE